MTINIFGTQFGRKLASHRFGPCHFLQASSQLPQLPFARQRRRFGEGRFLPRQGRQRGLLVHGGNGAIEPQIVGYTRKAPGFEDCGKTAVAAQECGGAERTDARRSRQFVGRIAAQRDEVRYLLRLDAVALAHLLRPDPRHLAGAQRVEDRGSRRSELKGVAIAARHQHGAAAPLPGRGRSGEKIVRLVAGALGIGETAGSDEFGNER